MSQRNTSKRVFSTGKECRVWEGDDLRARQDLAAARRSRRNTSTTASSFAVIGEGCWNSSASSEADEALRNASTYRGKQERCPPLLPNAGTSITTTRGSAGNDRAVAKIIVNPHHARATRCDRGYGRPCLQAVGSTSPKPGVLWSRTRRVRTRVVARWHHHLHDLKTVSRACCGLNFPAGFLGIYVVTIHLTSAASLSLFLSLPKFRRGRSFLFAAQFDVRENNLAGRVGNPLIMESTRDAK